MHKILDKIFNNTFASSIKRINKKTNLFNKCFRLQGEPVNLREQQDAVEFFMSLVESLDEALKALGHEQIMSKILGGSYSDQKICKGCPHR